MIDRFLSSTYGKSRRELAMDKLAQQLSNLPAGDLAAMSQSGLGAMSNQSPQMPPTAQATGASPTTGPRMPPQQQIQGAGLGGQAAMAGETGMKMAAAKMKMLAKLAEEESRSVKQTVAPLGMLGGAAAGAGLGAGWGGIGYLGSPHGSPTREMLQGAGMGALPGLAAGGVGAGLGALAGQGAESDISAALRGGLAGAGSGALAGAVVPSLWRGKADMLGAVLGGLTGAGIGGVAGGASGMYARRRAAALEEAREKMSAALQKYAFSLANAGRAINAAAKGTSNAATMGGRAGILLRHNAVPLATSAAGAAAGAYMGGRDGGGISGALGGAALGGVGGAVAGKAGQLGYRAATSKAKGTLGARLMGEVNREAVGTQKMLGVEGPSWKPFGGKPAAPAAGLPVDAAAGVVPPAPTAQPTAPAAPPTPVVKPPAPRQQAVGAVAAPGPGAKPKKMSAKQRRQQAMSEAGIAQPTSGLPG